MKLFKQKNTAAKVREPYDVDGLMSIHNHDFIKEKWFVEAYQRGVKASGEDYGWLWRVYTGLWVAMQAARLKGDFVECGVHRGFLSSSIMECLKWNRLDKHFYLFDTYNGLDKRQLTKDEIAIGRGEGSHEQYTDCYDDVVKNFAEFKRTHVIRGRIPETLTTVDIKEIAFMSIDMNNAKPEIEAITYFWDKMVQGGFILLDDYAYNGYYPQKAAMDKFAKRHKIQILSLPTGQGLIIKL